MYPTMNVNTDATTNRQDTEINGGLSEVLSELLFPVAIEN